MTPDPSTSRSHKFPDPLYAQAVKTADKEHERVAAVLVRALHAYVADPQGFNAAVAQLRGGKA